MPDSTTYYWLFVPEDLVSGKRIYVLVISR